ncbi:TatD family hydrolase [Candidatus Methylacidithermus pantelleriae]|uniref:Deoxyribonuclease YcfH n=1 Tax=Candidatus Methylacidithermus pantelleriae TaxID=2744239 RepID=A0A8J2BJS1_9BACT|nr:TatD family hydrolase [Candidatus Methylacidithermus pantelleriae]CAF0700817.1 Putative deoxyribonuclease YcfH [Candidatus Methylacidithermus pantelleriae]
MRLVDTHVHLDFPEFDVDRDQVMVRAACEGVHSIVGVSVDLDSSRRLLGLAQQYPALRVTVGIHPAYVGKGKNDANLWNELEHLAQEPKVVALGETGLDFHRLPQDPVETEAIRMAQRTAFQAHLQLAAKLGLPLVIHQRDAWEETWELLEPYRGKVRAVFHCFGGTWEQAERILRAGWKLSFTGTVTFRKSQALRALAAQLPEESFMIETDAPFLAPEPWRGRRNEPAWVIHVARVLAQARQQSVETIAELTTQNAVCFFALEG